MARTTVFGAGAMGTAVAMHLARRGTPTVLWASPHDSRVLASLTEDRRHPKLPEFLPDSLTVLGAADLAKAAAGVELAVMAAHSGGARTLARAVVGAGRPLPLVVGVAKGLEPDSGLRMSQVYAEEVGHDRVVSVGGPCLAAEIAQGSPTATVFAAQTLKVAEEAALTFRSRTFHVSVTDDVAGLEYCTVAKNVAAIGVGIVDGLAKVSNAALGNARAALFTRAFAELTLLVEALGGRQDTVHGLAGLGDTLVTSLGGRNRLYGEVVGEGSDPRVALERLIQRGMTVEGVDSTTDVHRLAAEAGLSLPYFQQIHAILFGDAPAMSLLDYLSDGKESQS